MPGLTDDEDTGALAGSDAEDALTPEDFSVGAAGTSGIGAAYDAAIKRLLAQRSGLSTRERIGAALVGFGQPNRHGWRGGVSNAAQVLLQQSLMARKEDEARRAQLEKLMLGRDVASARAASALEIAKLKKPEPKLAADTDQRMRLGYARRLFPGKADDVLVAQNLLYDPRVDKAMFQVYGARAAAGAGEPVEEVEVAPEGPTLEVFLPEARKANPGVPDEELIAFYNKKYGGR